MGLEGTKIVYQEDTLGNIKLYLICMVPEWLKNISGHKTYGSS
jgi:hypothetical protein